MADIVIEIDGKKLTAKPNQMVIQVADEAGIYIPRFCYHKHLTVAANCRMCLVEVEKSPKALPACATPVASGMRIFTKSQKTIEAQRAVMEFLLINHPLDCPICDQGGECELQDLSMGYGSGKSRYDESKRSIKDQNLGPLISTDMTRCIYCTRCVRFGIEIAGLPEMGDVNRGEHSRIGTFVEQALTSEVSGNIIDLCPVGALTSKPYRFTARPWELDQAPSVSPHDCIGSNLYVHTRYGRVMRVVSRENEGINQTWLADRDRFGYTGLYHNDRLEEPLAKINGEWKVVEWQKALEIAATGLHDVVAEHGADKIGALASPNSTTEEFYLLQKIIRALGSPHIDHRLREIDTGDQASLPAFPGLAMASIAELEQCDAVLLIGSNLRKEQPLAALRIRQAFLKGAKIMAVNSVDYDFNFELAAKHIIAPHAMPAALAAIINAIQPEFNDVPADAAAKAIADQLQGKQKVCLLLGASTLHHPHASAIRYLAQRLASLTNATVSVMTEGANSAGGWLAGAIPHRHAGGEEIHHHGLNAYQMLEKPRKGYILLNVEPDFDCANAAHAVRALQQAKFTIAISLYRNAVLDAHADVILPMAAFTETSGTYINAAGEWQSFHGVSSGYGSSRPAWKILRVLGNFLHLEGFNYESSEEIKHEVKGLVEKMPAITKTLSRPDHFSLATGPALSRIGDIPLYAIDSLVRRAMPLQKAQMAMEGEVTALRLHPETASTLRVQEGDRVQVSQPHTNGIELPIILDPRVAKQAAWIAGGISATRELGDLVGEIEIKKL